MDTLSPELKQNIQLELDTLRSLVVQDGPEPSDYPILTAVLEHLSDNISDEDERLYTNYLPQLLGDLYSAPSLIGLAFLKPHGYSGDFELLDKTYQHYISEDERARKWDAYWNQTALASALRNRKEYFKTLLFKTERFNPRARVLCFGSGPARAIVEYLQGQPNSHLSFVLVDADANALKVAKQGCPNHLEKLELNTCSLFDFRSGDTFDLIWSAHSFDYFDNENYSGLIQDLQGMLASGGQIAVGNFSHSDANTAFMRFLGWHVYHRSHHELMQLAEAAGIREKDIHIHNRAEDVNLFLHIGRDIQRLF